MKKLLTAAVVAMLLSIAPKYAHATYDGTPSTGSFTIATNGSLGSASATGSLTIVTTTALQGTQLNIGGYQFIAGRDFTATVSTVSSANGLVTAINASGAPVSAVFNVGDTVIALTADDVGSLYNGVGLVSSNSGTLSVSGATLTGGRDNASVTINAVQLVQGRDWYAADVASNTAIALAFSINKNSSLSHIVRAEPNSTAVYLRSIITPGLYSMATSGSVITKSQAAMSGGSQGILDFGNTCFLGAKASLPTSNVPAGCLVYVPSVDSTKIYLSTENVVGTQSWLGK